MTIYITAIDKELLAHAWIEATRLYGANRDNEWYAKYHSIYERMFDGVYSYEDERQNIQRLNRLSVDDIQNKGAFVLVAENDERLIAARGRLSDFIEKQPNQEYAVDLQDAKENRDLDMLDSD